MSHRQFESRICSVLPEVENVSTNQANQGESSGFAIFYGTFLRLIRTSNSSLAAGEINQKQNIWLVPLPLSHVKAVARHDFACPLALHRVCRTNSHLALSVMQQRVLQRARDVTRGLKFEATANYCQSESSESHYFRQFSGVAFSPC